MARKEDLRATRSKDRIKQAFRALLQEKGFAKTSVTDIIGLAHVNRSTFYAHFVDKFDLLNTVEDELLVEMAQISESIPENFSQGRFVRGRGFGEYITRVLEVISDNKELFAVIYDSEQGATFQKKLFAHMDGIWSAHHVAEGLKVDARYAQIAAVGMICALIEKWIESGCEKDIAEFSAIMSDITASFIEGLMQQQE